MKHRIKQRKLGRDSAHRKAMLANMAASLVKLLPSVKLAALCVVKVIAALNVGFATAHTSLYAIRCESEKVSV